MAYRYDTDLEFLGKMNSEYLSDLVYCVTHDKDGSVRFTAFRYTQVGIQVLSAPADTAKSLIHKDSRNPQLSHCSIFCRL